MQNTTTFDIQSKINPETGKPFGVKYGGTFSIRRPTLQDKTDIALQCAANLAAAGGIGVNFVNDELLETNFVFSQLNVISTTAALPSWFSADKIYEEDEQAVFAVAREVQGFIDSFRIKSDSTAGGETVPNDSILVSAEI